MSQDIEIISSAEDRAMRAADQLAAEGASVTAAAVRQRSAVAMSTAAAATKAWKAREKKAVEDSTEPVPEHLQARFLSVLEGVWREARTLTHAEVDELRVAGDTKLRASEEEVAQLTAAVEELEQESERAAERADDHASQLAAERSRADRAEGALAAVTEERDRLLAQLDAARAATVS
ncbi:replication region DNA-binding N-term [Cryobacterium psychrotolerans]|uniref:Replication region DNA-binding N-term n=1 Tax=Cryobacterium psychrotolerans TaxID=386301 RepID=A0A1G9B7D1_9MICO|nr:DNA-binding protein [Cryobacterium psychrotolerans]TFD84656.1 hypothetical protein E3T56_09355 [Cryobacterium psychrotolerans]SDK35441.1 replication region DNA-binding N-term [Cryobacterium psychrotolerans]